MTQSDATVYIVDDDSAIRDALTLMLEQEGYLVRLFESAEDFLAAYKSEQFGCAIIDIRMSGMSGMQLQEVICERNILLPVIFLSGHGTIQMTVKAMKAKAVDFLTKPVSAEKLLNSVRMAVSESGRILTESARYRNASLLLAGLTERERDVLAEAVQGHSNKEIARHLNISHRTVEIHKSRIMQKTGALNLLDLARIALEGSTLIN
ncbi:response regulator [Methylotenera sp.]|uniref:response regulator transcription factor n=1 Tax=Methylotenera sp. TaxID=2051956 RepID=UPI002487EC5D|nr:response regulator [Methylotenera sp.]MDI1361798.1 response regulator [Methylotenera sp.]